jgi:2-polyprenyl-6-methoxyphenol hydroxylase-like FAD-dependent oxidoreductase
MKTEFTDVLIVGAGPTGMALSIALLQQGVKHLIIDRLEQGQNTSRAGVIHAQTLDSLKALGVAERMSELGLRLTSFAIRDRDRALLRLSFDRLESAHPYLLMLPQNVTETVLAERIKELGGCIRRGVAAESIEQDERAARVTITQDGEQRVISAAWVVGGDGMQSVVRRASGIDFEGESYEQSFVLADVHLDQAPAPDEVSLFFSPDGLVVVAPLPDGTFRIVATLDGAPSEPTRDDVQALLDTRGPAARRSRVIDVRWSSRFRLHHRLAASYRNGRLLLMGDAAHVHSPAGGQGMNTGIVDAIVLGQLLADIARGARPEAELDVYAALRRPAAAQVLQLADRLTTLATVRNPIARALRNFLLRVVDLFPAFKRRIELSLSGLSRAALARVPRLGSPARSGRTLRRRELHGAADNAGAGEPLGQLRSSEYPGSRQVSSATTVAPR